MNELLIFGGVMVVISLVSALYVHYKPKAPKA